MILFAIALSCELKIIKEEIKNLKLPFKVDFLLTGVGNLNIVYSLKDYIDKKEKPDFIVNIGVCGKINDDFLDFFQVYRIKNLSNNKEIICPIYIKNGFLKSIACSEKIITDKILLGEEKFVDMESFGIDFICDKEKIPYIIIKKPFDLVSKNSLKVSLIDLQNCLKGFDYKKLLLDINDFLQKNKNPFNSEINDLKQKYKLTFSQTELLKIYINKCKAFGQDYKQIIKNLKNLEKNQLLELIKSN